MRWLVIICLVLATDANALNLSISGAEIVTVEAEDAGSARLPELPWTPGTTTTGTEGAIRRTVLEVPSDVMTTLQMIAPLRSQLEDEGYRQILSCADAECGGFDFRFQLDLIGEPQMHVDLGNYRYLLMRKETAEPHSVAIVASPSVETGFIHITEVSKAVFVTPDGGNAHDPTRSHAPIHRTEGLIDSLVATGRAVLGDLEFGVGSAELGPGPFSSLEQLSTWLATNPSARVILVGHTDAVGSLAANTTLSQRRATAVSDRLATGFGTEPGQLQAAGAGYLAPVASNLTAEGQGLNRRVEVVLLSLN